MRKLRLRKLCDLSKVKPLLRAEQENAPCRLPELEENIIYSLIVGYTLIGVYIILIIAYIEIKLQISSLSANSYILSLTVSDNLFFKRDTYPLFQFSFLRAIF